MNKILWLPALLIISAHAAAPSDSVLRALTAERRVAIGDPARVQGSRPQIDLTPLVGASRRALTRSLGAPDFCSSPDDCLHSARVGYFFFPFKALATQDVGDDNVEVTVSAGGGWALEISFSHDAVATADWVAQK